MAERGGDLADALVKLAELDLPQNLYRDFPDWVDHELELCSSFFAAIGSLGTTLQLLEGARSALAAEPA